MSSGTDILILHFFLLLHFVGDGGSAANTDIASQASSCSPTAPLGPPELPQVTDTGPAISQAQPGAQQPAGSDANPPRVSSRQISGHRQDNRQETGGIIFSDPRGAVNDEGAIQQPFEHRIGDNYEPPPPYPGLPRSLSATERNTARNIAARNMFQHAASVPIMRTTRGNRSINTQLIPSIVRYTHITYCNFIQLSQDGDPNTRYAKQMNYSLCLLIVCLALCNISSLIFTLPSIVCAWKVRYLTSCLLCSYLIAGCTGKYE